MAAGAGALVCCTFGMLLCWCRYRKMTPKGKAIVPVNATVGNPNTITNTGDTLNVPYTMQPGSASVSAAGEGPMSPPSIDMAARNSNKYKNAVNAKLSQSDLMRIASMVCVL